MPHSRRFRKGNFLKFLFTFTGQY